MNFKSFSLTLLTLILTSSAIAQIDSRDEEQPQLVASWEGTVGSGNRPCEVKLYSTTGPITEVELGATVDLEISMTRLFHGAEEVKTYRFETATKTLFEPSGLGDDVFKTIFRGKNAEGIKLASALFNGVANDELRDLVKVAVSVPHGGHAHNYICKF